MKNRIVSVSLLVAAIGCRGDDQQAPADASRAAADAGSGLVLTPHTGFQGPIGPLGGTVVAVNAPGSGGLQVNGTTTCTGGSCSVQIEPCSNGSALIYNTSAAAWQCGLASFATGTQNYDVKFASGGVTGVTGSIFENGTTIDFSGGSSFNFVTDATGDQTIQNGTGPLLTLVGSAGSGEALLLFAGSDDNGDPSIASGAQFAWIKNTDGDRRLGLWDSAHTSGTANTILTLLTGSVGGGLQCYTAGTGGIGGSCQLNLNVLAGGDVDIAGALNVQTTSIAASQTITQSAGFATLHSQYTYFDRQVITASGTYTPGANGTQSVRGAIVFMCGGGGGGGGVPNATTAAVAGGGASGAWVQFHAGFAGAALTGGSDFIGAAGGGGALGSNAGGSGGETSIIISGTTYYAEGGSGGQSMTASNSPPFTWVGAHNILTTHTQTTGDFWGFSVGGTGISLAVASNKGGDGGNSPMGGGGFGGYTSAVTGLNGGNCAGGGGASTASASGGSAAGGSGGSGIIIIDEYL
jgi:hypothetical protein